MFGQWFLFIWSMLLVSGPVKKTGRDFSSELESTAEIRSFVQANSAYGWEVSGTVVLADEVNPQ